MILSWVIAILGTVWIMLGIGAWLRIGHYEDDDDKIGALIGGAAFQVFGVAFLFIAWVTNQ